jgi:hypothetical protein
MGLFSFLKRPRAAGDDLGPRYRGRPLLILLENYVISAIGHLEKEQDELAASATQRVFGGGEDWRATLRATLHLESSLDDSIREMWTKNQTIAERAGVVLKPSDFARVVVDENFAHLLTKS